MSLSDWRTYQNVVSSQESVTVPSFRTSTGEYPEPNFEFLKQIYTDPDAFTNINFIANRGLGEGFHFECTAVDAPNYQRTELEDFLTEFFKTIQYGDERADRGFDTLSKTIVQEMGWGGTHLLELLDPDAISALAPVPLTTIWKWHRDTSGRNVSIQQFPQVNSAPLTPSRYLTYRWNSIDRSPWGHGLTYPLSRPRIGTRGEVLPPLILVWWGMQYDAAARLHRAAVPHAIFGAPGMDPTTGKAMSEALRDPGPASSFLTNAPVTVAMDAPTSRGNFQAEFDLIRNRVDIGLQSMFGTMIASDKGFSFASSETGYSMVDIVVWDLQKSFKRTTDYGLVLPVSEQNGFDANLLKPELIFNIPDKPADYEVSDINNAVQNGWISKEEARAIVKQLAKWPIPEQLPPELLQQQVLPIQSQQPGQAQQPQGQQQVDPKMALLAQQHAQSRNGNGNGQHPS